MFRSWLMRWARRFSGKYLALNELERSGRGGSRRRSPSRFHIETLEDRTLLTGDLIYQAVSDGPLTLRLVSDELQVFESLNPAHVLSSARLSDLTAGVRISGAGFDVDLTLDASLPAVPGGVFFEGGGGRNRLLGPARNLTWNVAGAGAGHVGDAAFVRFTGVEQLVGAAGTDDTFVIAPGGSLSEGVVGGDGGFDSMSIAGTPGDLVFTASGPDSGTVFVNGVAFPYSGLEPIDASATTVTVQGNLVAPNQLVLERNAAGKLQVRSLNGSMESVSFDDPAVLKIQLGLNNDTLTIGAAIAFAGSLQIDGGIGNDSVTVAADVTLPGKAIRIDAETITVGGTLSTRPTVLTDDSGDITLTGQTIVVQSSGQLRTDLPAGSTGAAGKIELIAAVTSLSGLSPIDVFPSPDPTITLHPGSQIRGGVISLNATKRSQGAVLPITLVSVQTPSASVTVQGATLEGDKVSIAAMAEDMNFLEEGSWTSVNNSVIEPINNYISNLIPTVLSAASVMIRKSVSTVTVQDATILSRGDVEIGATTKVESTADAGGGWDPTVQKFNSSIAGFIPLAVAYSEAHGTSKTILSGNTSIDAAGDVTIASSTDTKAEAGASTNVNTGTVSKRKTTQAKKETSFGASVAVTWANTVANTEIGQGVLILADGNVDVTADGKIKNQAKGRTGVYIDGSVGSAVAIAMDTADIKTLVDGTIRAGSISALEAPRVGMTLSGIDPDTDTFTLASHGFTDGQKLLYLSEDPTNSSANHGDIGSLVNGQTYVVRVIDVNRFQLIRGQALTLDASRIDPASTQTLTRRAVLAFDPIDQIDAANNTITLPGHDLLEGQMVEYYLGNADGEVIGGLENQTTYFVHVFDANTNTIQLMTDEVDHPASLGPVVHGGTTYYLLDLTAPSRAETSVTFEPDDEVASGKALVDPDADTLTFEGDHNFATGQKVVYTSGSGAIGGLNPGGTYYVIKIESNSLRLAVTEADAQVGLAVNLTSRGSGGGHALVGRHQHLLVYEDSTASFTPRTAVGNDGGGGTITFDTPHNWQTGDVVVYRTDPTVQSELPLTTITQINLAPKVQTFDPTATTSSGEAVIDAPADTIFFDDVHYFVSGQRVVYSSGGDVPVGGLIDGATYFVLTGETDPERLQLALRTPGPGTHATPLLVAGEAYYVVHLTPGVATGTAHKFTGNPVDLTDNLLVVPGHSFFTGQKVVYQTGGNTPLSAQLTDGGEYYVIRVDANRLRLSATRTEASAGVAVPLRATATGTAHNLVTTRAVTRFDVTRTTPVLDAVNDTIELPTGHGLTVGARVVYSSEDGLAIPGLSDGIEYEVLVVSGDRVQLTNVGDTTPIDLHAGATVGLLGHRLTLSGGEDIVFDPTLQPTVDVTNDRLWMPGNRFRAGERVTYLTGGGLAIPGLVDGRDYLVTPFPDGTLSLTDATTLLPVDLAVGAVSGLHGFERIARGVRYDSAIGGLVAGEIYHVTRVDATTIRLSQTLMEAHANVVVDVTLPSGQPLTNKHTFTSPATRSGIQARLAAENTALAQSRIGGTPTLGDLITGEIAQDPKTAKKLIKGAKGFMGLSGSIPFSINASVGVSTLEHDVLARIGPNAVLVSQSDLTLKASIEEKASINVDGSVTTENAEDGKKVAISAAVAYGHYDNDVQAVVSGGASIDARGTLAVNSELTYPLLIDNLPFSPLRFNINDPDEGSVVEELGTLLGGTGGLTRVMNVWASATGRTPDVDVTVTGSVAIMDYLNRSEAIIGAGARINQDPALHDPAQKVEVTAATTQVLISVAGNVHVELNDNGIMNAARTGSTAGKTGTKTWRSSPISLFGTQAKTVGLGGSILVQSLDNHTIARIDEGAVVRTGAGGLSVTANENVYSFELAQTGGDSGLIGVSGSVSIAQQTSETVAHVKSGVRVAGGSTLVGARSQVDHINITGAVQMAKMVGVGVSVGVTDVTRHTLALIGNRLAPSDSTIGSAGTLFDVADLTVKAESTGAIWGVGVAGAIVSDLAGTDLRFEGLRGQQPAAAEPVGVGVSGTVIVNTVRDTTQAYVNDNGLFQTNAGAVLLDSADRTNLYSLSGALTLVFDKPAQSPGSKTAVGIAGSFSWNTLEMTTEAFLIGGRLSGTNDLKLLALREGQVLAITAGISGVAAVGSGTAASGAGAGSVTVNAIHNATRAYLDRVLVTVDGPIELNSTDKSAISAYAIAGAGAGANSTGGLAAAVSAAGSVAINSIDNVIDSSIRNSPGTSSVPGVAAAGAITLSATDETRIRAVSGALAVSVAIGGGSGLSVAGGVGISVALNDIGAGPGQSTRAYIDSSTVTAAGDLRLDARSTAVITSFAIAGVLAGAGSSGAGFTVGFGGAAAGSRNTIKLNLEASIRTGSSVTTTAGGQVALTALDRSQILSDTGGISVVVAAGSTGGNVAAGIGGAIALNTISNTVTATINASTVLSAGALSITARSQKDPASSSVYRIDALAFGVGAAGSGSAGAGLAGAFAGAGSVAINKVDNAVEASIRSSGGARSVQASGGAVTVSASDDTKIRADSGGVALAVAAVAGTGAGASAALGASYSENQIGKLSGHSVHAIIDSSNVTANGDVLLEATSTAVIQTVSIGGSVAVSAGTGMAAGAGAGAGALTINGIALDLQSGITNGSVVTTNTLGDVTLKTTDASEILADAGAVAVAIAVALGTGGGASASGSLGGAYAENGIANLVQAVIDSSTVLAAGDVALTATSAKRADSTSPYRIDALALGIAASVTVTSTPGLTGAFAGAGSVALNKMDNTVEAAIRASGGARSVQAPNGSVTLTASDDSSIRADTGGFALGLAVPTGPGGTGVAASLGGSYSENQIGTVGHSVRAIIDRSRVTAGGPVQLTALSTATINTLAMGGSVAVAGGSALTSVAVAGAAAATKNLIAVGLEASIKGGSVVSTSSGSDISLTATDHSEIVADAGGIAVAVAASSAAGTSVSAAVGAGVALNTIANTVQAFIDGSTVFASGELNLSAVAGTAPGIMLPIALVAVDTVNDTITRTDHGLKTGERVLYHAASGAIGGLVEGQSYFVVRLDDHTFQLVDSRAEAFKQTPAPINLTGSGAGASHALEKPRIRIDTAAFAGTAAATGSGGGGVVLAATGAGAAVINAIDNKVEAYIKDSPSVLALEVNLAARDDSTIRADAGGVALGIAASAAAGTTVSVSVGAALTENRIGQGSGQLVGARIVNSTVTALSGRVQLEARSSQDIGSFTIGGAISGAGSASGVVVGGAVAGAVSLNSIRQTVESVIKGQSNVTAADDVTLIATDSSRITADAGGVAASVAVGVAGISAAFSVGLAVSQNTITNTVLASIDTSRVTASQDVELDAISRSVIDAYAFGGAGALSISGTVAAGSGAAAGAFTTNTITNNIDALITDSGATRPVEALAGSILLDARDDARINASSQGGSLSISVSATPGSATVAVALTGVEARNAITNGVRSRIVDSVVRATLGTVQLTSLTLPTSSITSTAAAAAMSMAISGTVSVAASGAGAGAYNTITNTVEASITGASTVTALTQVNVQATDSASITAGTGAGALAVGLISGSIGVSVNTNTITNTVTARVDGSVFTAGPLRVKANSTAHVGALSFATSFSAAAAGAGSAVTTTVQEDLTATLGPNSQVYAGDVIVQAIASQTADAHAKAATISGGIAAGVSRGSTTLKGTIAASVQGTVNPTGNVLVEAVESGQAFTETWSLAGGVIGLAGAGGESLTEISPTVSASIVDGTIGTVTNPIAGKVIVRSILLSDGDAKSFGVSFSPTIAAAGTKSVVTLNPRVNSYLGGDTEVRTTGSVSVMALQNYRVDGDKLVADRRLSLADTESGSGTIVFSGAGADSTVNATPKLQSYVDTNAQAHAGQDVTLLSLSLLETEARAKSTVVGLVSVGQALTNATASGEVLAYVDGRVEAGEKGSVLAVARHSALANATGYVVGIGAAETISISDVSPKIIASVGKNAKTAEFRATDAALIAISEAQSQVTSKSNIDGAGKPDESKSNPEVTLQFGPGSKVIATNRNFQMLEDPNVVRPEMTVADLLRPNTARVLENTTYVATLTPTPFETETPTFSIRNEKDGALFQVNSTTGDLTFRHAPDFENPGDATADNLYEVPIVATYPKGNVVNMMVRVQVDDVAGLLNAETTPDSLAGPTIQVSEVVAVGAAAAARWKATGLSASQDAALDSLVYQVDDLPAGQLAVVSGHVVTIDRDANGNGWFVDATPQSDEEFGALGARGYTAAPGPVAGLMDLLTVLLHECGHVLGLAHAGSPINLMFSALGVGTRRLPTTNQAQGAVPGGEGAPEVMYATGDNVLSVSNLGTRYERVMADKESTDPAGSAPVTRVKAEAAPKLKIEIGSEAIIQSGATDEVVIRVESNHTATALGVNPDVLFLLGVVEAEAKVGGTIEVSIGGTIIHTGSLTLELHSANQAIAIGEALAVGPVGGTGVKTTATVEPVISTYVSAGSNLQVGGNFTIRTLAEDTALAVSRGTAIGGGFAVGVGLAEAIVKPTVSTYVDDGATITAGGDITIETLHNIDGEGKTLDRGAKAIAEASAGALVAGGGGASATATSTPEVSAYVHAGAKLTAGPDATVTVRARSHHPALAQTGGMGLGLAGVGVSLASATSSGKTSAYLDGKVLGGGNLVVSADAADIALADTQAVSGGLLSGRGARSTTSVAPTVEAYLGAGSETTVSGDVTVLANARPDGDARAIGFGGGGIDVGVSIAETTVEPEVNAYIGLDAKVTAGGNLSVLAEAGVPAPTPGDTFSPDSDVNLTDRTIRFTDHGLNTGDVVLYDSNGNTAVGGLTSRQQYPVLRVDVDRVQLGAAFDGALVEGSRDTIVFTDTHNLPDGTRVLYQTTGAAAEVGGLVNGSVYIVKVIDPLRIKLLDPNVVPDPAQPFSSGDVEADDQTITLTGHGFAPGQAVTYRVPKPIDFVSTGVDVQVNPNGTLALNPFFRTIIEEDNDAIYLGKDSDNNGVIEGHGLATGELVRYQATPTVDFNGDGILDGNPIGNLTSGDTYAVIKRNDYQVHLASLVESFDADAAVDEPDNILTVAGAFTTGDRVVYLAMGGTVIGGLTDRGVYYVRTFGTDGVKFYNDERDAFLDINPIDLRSVGSGTQRLYRQIELEPFTDTTADQRVVHTLSRELDAGGLIDGQTYYVNRLNADQFRLETSPGAGAVTLGLFGNGSSAVHTIGTEGVDLSPSSGDHRLVVNLTSQPSGAHRLLGPGGSSLRLNRTASNDGVSTATAKGSSGKIIGVEVNLAKATGSSTIQAYVAGNTTSGPGASILSAGGDVAIQSTSKLNLSSQINNGSGGFVAVGYSQANTDSDQENTAYVGDNAVVTAGKNFSLGALTTQSARSGAVAIGGGFIQIAVANATTDIDYTTDVFVGGNARVTAGETLKLAGVSTTENTEAIANADARGFGAGTDANDGGRDGGRSVGDADGRGIHIGKTSALTETEVRGGARLTGNRVEISATMPTVNARSISTSFAGGLGADSDATARVENDQATLVTLRGSSEVTGINGVVIQSMTNSAGTTADATAVFRGGFGDTDATAINDVSLTSTVVTEADATVRAGGNDPVALFVGTESLATNPRNAHSDRFGIDIGEAKTLGGIGRNTDVAWNADVIVLGGASPELHIDSAGTIVKAVGVTVNGGLNAGTLTGTDVSVDDITGAGGGMVLFDTHGGAISGSGGEWTFNDTAASVRVANESDLRLVINNISLLGTGTPGVELRAGAGAVTLEFDVRHAVAEAVIDIRNSGEADVLLNNNLPINNPLGVVRITNLGGSVLAVGPNAILRANELEIVAAEDIGSGTSRLQVELIERLGHEEELLVAAGRDANLAIAGRLLAPGSTMTVGIDRIEAGRDVNLLLAQTVKDSPGTGPAGGSVQVTVPADSYSEPVVQHFRPDPPGAVAATLDPVYFVETSLAVTIDSVFAIDLLRAGRSISLIGADTSAAAKLVGVVAVTEILGFGGGERIDGTTNGNIGLTHVGGNTMPIGTVESTTGSVDLLNPDDASTGQDLVVLAGGRVKAATTVRLRAGDDVATASTSLLQAGSQLEIGGDALDIDIPGTTITLNGSLHSPLVLIDGGNDDDVFLLNNANGVNAGLLSAVVRVDGGGLRDYLRIDDSADPGADTGSMTGTRVRGLGMGGDGVEYSGIDDLEVRLSQGGTGFDVFGSSVATKVLGGSGDDTLAISSATRTLADVLGELTLEAAGGAANHLILDDSGSTADSTVTITQETISDLASLLIRYSATGGHFTNAGAANGIELRGASSRVNTFNIQRTLEGSTTRVVGNGQQDVFKVFSDASGSGVGSTAGSHLDGIRGDLSVVGGSGADNRLIVSNFADPSAGTSAVVTADRITGLAPATIFYSAAGQFNNGTAGDGILVLTGNTTATALGVRSTLQGSTIKVAMGQANDGVVVGNTASSLAEILGALTLDGGGHLATPTTTLGQGTDSHSLPTGDRVTFNDQGDPTEGLVYELTASTLIRSGSGTITFGALETVALNTGTQAATVNVAGTADTVNTTVMTGIAADVVTVLATGLGSNVEIRTGDGDDAIYLRGTGAGGFTSLHAGLGNDLIRLASDAAAGVLPGLGSLDGLAGIIALDAAEGPANRLILDNSTGTPSGNAVWTTPVVGLLGKVTGLAPATIHYAATGGTFSTSGDDGVLALASGTGSNVVVLKGTLAGSSYQVVGGPLADSFHVGDTRIGNQGDLDLIGGMVTLVGNGGGDSLEINDHGSTGEFNYLIDPSRVTTDTSTVRRPTGPTTSPPRAFAPGGIVYNATGNGARDTIATLRLDGTDQANTFSVVPSALTLMTINGNQPVSGVPVVGGGDYLRLDTSRFADRVGGRRLHLTSVGNGFWAFSDPHLTRSVYFESIERFNHVGVIASSADPGSVRQTVVVRDAETGAIRFTVTPYAASYRGGFSTAVGDINFDGLPDLITVAGANHAPVIRIYSLRPDANGVYRGELLTSFLAFNVAFRSGSSLAVGDVNGDGVNDVIVGAGAGWLPQVKVFNGLTLQTARGLIGSPFNVFSPAFRGGVNVAVGDLNRDGFTDIVTTGARNGPPTVNIFSGRTRRLLRSFPGFQSTYRGGMNVSVGDFNGDAVNDVILGLGTGTTSRVLVVNGATLFRAGQPRLVQSFFPRTPIQGRAVRVKAYGLNGGDLDSERAFVVSDVVGTSLTYYYSLNASDLFPRLPVLIRDGANQ